jgi:anaerobic magnesium-protoporphyrin IX monomethyl ester cyclase
VLEDGSFDYAVAGEGEETFLELLNALESNQPLERISGLMLRVDGKPRLVGVRPPKQEIDELEIDWPLLDPEKYFGSRMRNSENTLKHSSRLLPVFTSRGCPYNCYFCHNLFGKKFRARSVDHVLSEIDFLVREYGVEELEIIDDSFNLDAKRGKEILKKIAGRDYQLWLSFPNGIRADLMDEEFLDLMKAAGTYRVDYAIESANPERQIEMKKRLDLKRVKWTIEQTYQRGIMAAGYFILGFPGETEEEMKTTIDFALKSKLQIASFFHLNPFPGTALTESDEKLRALSRKISLADYSTMTMNLSAVSDQRLKDFRKSAYRKFYFSPFRIWSNLMLAPKNFRTVRSVFDVVLLSTRDSVNY